MAITTRDLMKVKDVPDVRAAIEARDAAVDALRKAYREWQDADQLVDQCQDELDEVAARALEARRQGD